MKEQNNPMGELTIIFAVCLVGEGIGSLIPFPSAVLSMMLMTLLLWMKWIKEEQIDQVSSFFMKNMGIFYVPACIGMMEYGTILMAEIIPFLLIAGFTTPLVYGATGLTVQIMMKKKKHEEKEE